VTAPKLTLYVNESVRKRVKTAAAHSNQSISEFLLPFIEAALELEEERMRVQLAVNREKIPNKDCSMVTAQ